MHALGVTLQTLPLKSLTRYTDLWLPMVNNNPNQELVPPSDIAWLWHCHRLAPFSYVAYLQVKFGIECPILEATPPFCFQIADDEKHILDQGLAAFENAHGFRNDDDEVISKQQENQTRELWSQLYPKEPFFNSATSSNNHTDDDATKDNNNKDFLFLNGFDLLGSTQRQATFLWQVSGEKFDHDVFLQDGVNNYYKFLQLRKNKRHQSKSHQVIVPTYQIDLMWHTHILTSLTLYYRDCQAILGHPLHHDDSLNDRIEGGRLDVAFQETKASWLEEYGEPYFVSGGMYRGEPPKEFFQSHWTPIDSSCEIPTGPFLKMIGVQGATSTNPVMGVTTSATMGILKCDGNSNPPQFPGDLLVPHHKTGKLTPICAYFCFRGHSCRYGDDGCQFCHVRRLEDLPVKDRATFSQWVDIEPGVAWAGPNDDYSTVSATVATPLVTQYIAVDGWTSVDGVDSSTGSAGFVAANAKTRGANANPSKNDYIFGRGSKGIGYYHHTTQEAYVILEKRIANRVAEAKMTVNCHECFVAMFTCGMGHPQSIEDEKVALEELRQIGEIVSERAKADVPVGAVGISAQEAKMDKNKKRVYDTFYSGAGHWYFPSSCYTAGGGCGASGGDGGGGGCGGAGGTYCAILFVRVFHVAFLILIRFPFLFVTVPGCGGGGK